MSFPGLFAARTCARAGSLPFTTPRMASAPCVFLFSIIRQSLRAGMCGTNSAAQLRACVFPFGIIRKKLAPSCVGIRSLIAGGLALPSPHLTPRSGCSHAVGTSPRRAASRAAVGSVLSQAAAPQSPRRLWAVSFVSYVLFLSSQSCMGCFVCS